jgi:hypothetical protein
MPAPRPLPGLKPRARIRALQLQTQYDALQDAIGLGARTVRFQDRTIEYQSVDEMIKAANYLYLQLASTGGIPGVTGVKRQIRMYTDKGL